MQSTVVAASLLNIDPERAAITGMIIAGVLLVLGILGLYLTRRKGQPSVRDSHE